MVQIQRANVVLTVPSSEVDKYMAKGFSVIDEKTGKVIKQSVPTELNQLQKAYSEHVAKIKQLESELAALKSIIQSAAGDAKSPAAPKGTEEKADDGWDDWSEAEEVEDDKPKKRKKSK